MGTYQAHIVMVQKTWRQHVAWGGGLRGLGPLIFDKEAYLRW